MTTYKIYSKLLIGVFLKITKIIYNNIRNLSINNPCYFKWNTINDTSIVEELESKNWKILKKIK